MKNPSTPHQKTTKDTLSFNAGPASAMLKLRCILLAAFLLQGAFVYAQAPTISYTGPQTYTAGKAINPLAPTSSGVAPIGYNGNYTAISEGGLNLGELNGVAVDLAGNMYVTSSLHMVYKIHVNGGKPTAIYTGDQTSIPTGIAVDISGNVYFTDLQEHALRKIPAIGGAPVTLATGLADPLGVAVDIQGNVYVAVGGAGDIIKIPVGGGSPAVLRSGFNIAYSVALDGTGNVFVFDFLGSNAAIKEIPVNGGPTITIAAGFSDPNVYGPFALAIDDAGYIYLTDGDNLSIKKLPADGASIDTINYQPANRGDVLYAVAVNHFGNIYALNSNSITKATPVGNYFISPALPAGLNFDESTGTISGTPTSPAATATYTIEAYNSFGGTFAHVVITVANADLASMQPSAGTLSPIFKRVITNYADTVSYTNTAIKLTPTASDPQATIKVNGVVVASGSPSQAIALAEGPNTITTVVTAADGVSTKTYTVIVFRPYSNDANLSFMQPTAGMMSPIFTPTITSYNDTVNYTNLAMQITPVAYDPLATIKVNGVTVTSGSLSQAISLNEGLNTITTVVTAPDGHTTKTFTISVMRAFSTDAFLTQIQPSAGMMSPVFNPMVTGYADEVNNSNAAITITPAVDDPLATLKVNGAAVASGTTSQAIPLAVGSNTITTVVTAPDGVTTKTYTLTVTRDVFPLTSFNSAYQPVGVAIANVNPQITDDGLSVHQEISPNGDGINDFLMIQNIANYPDNKLSIMNREGQLIFEAKGYDNSSKVFDGHSNKNGQMQLPGTYFYQLEYTVSGVSKHRTGFVVLRY